MIGPEDGTILEIVWTPELREALEAWLALDGQMPTATAGDFTPARISELLERQCYSFRRAVETLGALLAHHAIKPLDADIAALKPPRPALAQHALPMPTRTTPP